ncbi:NADPH:quinone oxidoreductase family protein [Neoroseomonas soli]|uniref:NADPH:quinone oxidoreductase family protein n=1 Tax=Neoroseomonas soli TaxID=1081025 RepID=A0A9X9X1I0_9PROT|nr:NADPH:quinone oxidoreductase family protein [Neoroseomonas soli]MBR0673259.1 NADPH:quinone oxidoreductase family protein [Neoroseomonas soli]
MRAILCESWRPFDELELKDIPPPPMRPRGVRIRVEASGVSFATQLVVEGKYQRKPPLPFVPGTEVVGTVFEAAPDADAPPVGTRVFAVLDWGGYAEEAIADDIHVIPIPEGLPAEAAVAFPISYPTAGSGLLWRGRIAAGDWVLVHGAAGGVGLAGVEIAKAVGARVIARAGAAKHGLLRARGADVVLDSAQPFRDAVREATGGQGVACVLDTIGGDVFEDSLRCLGDGGTLVVVGFAGGGIPTVAANILLLKNIAVAGVNWGTYVGWSPGDNRRVHAARARELWAQLMAWWQAGKLKPEVHAGFPLGQFREAMAEVRGRRSVGRVVLRP